MAVTVVLAGPVDSVWSPGARGRRGETTRVADSSAAGPGRVFQNSTPPSKQNRVGKPPEPEADLSMLLVSYGTLVSARARVAHAPRTASAAA